jgi:hypothetical protein
MSSDWDEVGIGKLTWASEITGPMTYLARTNKVTHAPQQRSTINCLKLHSILFSSPHPSSAQLFIYVSKHFVSPYFSWFFVLFRNSHHLWPFAYVELESVIASPTDVARPTPVTFIWHICPSAACIWYSGLCIPICRLYSIPRPPPCPAVACIRYSDLRPVQRSLVFDTATSLAPSRRFYLIKRASLYPLFLFRDGRLSLASTPYNPLLFPTAL